MYKSERKAKEQEDGTWKCTSWLEMHKLLAAEGLATPLRLIALHGMCYVS